MRLWRIGEGIVTRMWWDCGRIWHFGMHVWVAYPHFKTIIAWECVPPNFLSDYFPLTTIFSNRNVLQITNEIPVVLANSQLQSAIIVLPVNNYLPTAILSLFRIVHMLISATRWLQCLWMYCAHSPTVFERASHCSGWLSMIVIALTCLLTIKVALMVMLAVVGILSISCEWLHYVAKSECEHVCSYQYCAACHC